LPVQLLGALVGTPDYPYSAF